MADLFSVFGQFGGLLTVAKWAGYIFLAVVIAGILTVGFLYLIVQFKSKMIIEINLVTRKIKYYKGRFKKNSKGIKMLWVRGLKKFIPQVQEEDVYSKGFKEVIILLKDNNGLHHTVRMPNYEEILEWYEKVHEVNIETDEGYEWLKESMKTIYLLPNPSEDLDWLANQCEEAKKEFIEAWWKSPIVLMVGTIFICSITFILTLIISKRM